MTGNGATEPAFEDELTVLGFRPQGASRRGGVVWSLAFNSYLTFSVHDFRDHVVLTWSFALGEYLHERDWVIGSGEASFHQVYPRHDVRLPARIRAVEAEITRVLGTLRLDLGDPGL